MIWVLVAIGVVALLVLGVVLSYNRFVSQQALVRESWRQIDVELHRRYDLVPELVQRAGPIADRERAVVDEAVRSREAAVPDESEPSRPGRLERRAERESALSGALRQLFTVSDNYPELAANPDFLELRQQLTETEDRIVAGKRFYNANARAYNVRVETFPSRLVASPFSFVRAEYFEPAELSADPARSERAPDR